MLHQLQTTYCGELPHQFTNPFCYEPHPLCLDAASQVRAFLREHTEWHQEISNGKMFGVLVVRSADAEDTSLRFLAAYSGLLDGRNDIPYFVPPIYDYLRPEGYFQQKQAEITKINETIRQLEGSVNMDSHPEDYTRLQRVEIAALKRIRRQQSEALQDWLFEQYNIMNARAQVKTLKQVFKDYYREQMLHPENFEVNQSRHHIPSGTGECCAPRLLQYAFQHHLQPLCMAEFWLGRSPKDEVRHHGQFYPACNKKCRPLLHFMLQGLDVEESFLERHNRELLTQVRTLYEDDTIVVIDKPSGLLSVPSRDAQASVLDWIRLHYATPSDSRDEDAYTPAPVHRLDQDTSGILIIAKTRDALRHLQHQFYEHTVRKTYTALLDGRPASDEGLITLPLRRDPIDSPRQMVDYEHGKPCRTRYKVIQVQENTSGMTILHPHQSGCITRIQFFPETGRTHQLRMHSAHADGLACPIVGDKLYGRTHLFASPSSYQSLLWPRLMLHATTIDFIHPCTLQPLHIESPVPF